MKTNWMRERGRERNSSWENHLNAEPRRGRRLACWRSGLEASVDGVQRESGGVEERKEKKGRCLDFTVCTMEVTDSFMQASIVI